MNSLKELVERVEELRNDYGETSYTKFPEWIGATAGCEITIEWLAEFGEEPMIDTGYIFLLPGHEEYHVLDAIVTEGIVHIPFPVGVEKNICEPEWVPLVDLLNNVLVTSIELKNNE